MRDEPAFGELLERAKAARDAARDAFCEAGGEALLGVSV